MARAGSADEIIAGQGLQQITDNGSLDTLIDELLATNPTMVAEFRAGKEKAFNALVGQVMKATRGQGQPAAGQRTTAQAARLTRQGSRSRGSGLAQIRGSFSGPRWVVASRVRHEATQILVVLQAGRLPILLLGFDHRLLRLDLVIGIAQAFYHLDRQLAVVVELRLLLEFLALPADFGDSLFGCLDCQ
jgi:hypothetical protein